MEDSFDTLLPLDYNAKRAELSELVALAHKSRKLVWYALIFGSLAFVILLPNSAYWKNPSLSFLGLGLLFLSIECIVLSIVRSAPIAHEQKKERRFVHSVIKRNLQAGKMTYGPKNN